MRRGLTRGAAAAMATTVAAVVLSVSTGHSAARAATITIACGAVGIEYELCREGAEAWAAETGHDVEFIQSPSSTNERLGLFQQLLAAQSSDVDVFQIDVVWPGVLGRHFVDLRRYIDAATIEAHFATAVDNNTVDGELKAMPWFADVGVLYYRRDLLDEHGVAVPRTWPALAEAARRIVAAERANGNQRLMGFVFQGKPYEGLTCNALEWIGAYGGGHIVAPNGRVTLDNPRAAAALKEAASWVGDIAPQGVLTYAEEEARGVFQAGHAVFMRNWPYAWALMQRSDSPVKGRVGVAPLPAGPQDAAAGGRGTLGGSGLALSRYSNHPHAGADLVRYLTSAREQRRRAMKGLLNPTIPAVYDDPELRRARPVLAQLRPLLAHALTRPARIAGTRYNQLSAIFWNAVHDTLAGRGDATTNLAEAAHRLERLSRRGRW